MGYRNPPEAKAQVQPRAGPVAYPRVTDDYKASDWSRLTTVPAVASRNRDAEFDKTHSQGQNQHNGAGYPPETAAYKPSNWLPPTTRPAVTSHSKDAYISRQGQHQHVGARGLENEFPYDNTPPSNLAGDMARTGNGSKEGREVMTAAGYANKEANGGYVSFSEISQYATENRNINNPGDKKPLASPRTMAPANPASKDTQFTASSKRSCLLWHCTHCQMINDAHHTSCVMSQEFLSYQKIVLG